MKTDNPPISEDERVVLLTAAHKLFPNGTWSLKLGDGLCSLNFYCCNNNYDSPELIAFLKEKIAGLLPSWEITKFRCDQYCLEIDWSTPMEGEKPTMVLFVPDPYGRLALYLLTYYIPHNTMNNLVENVIRQKLADTEIELIEHNIECKASNRNTDYLKVACLQERKKAFLEILAHINK